MTLGLVRRHPLLGRLEEFTFCVLGYLVSPVFRLRYQLNGRNPRRLHYGCGRNKFSGWINADLSPFADLVIDLRRKLPFPDNFLELAYSEHVMEHVPYNVSVKFLGELHRTLTPGGTIRIAMPDLDDLVDGYQNDWRRSDWLSWPSFSHIETRCEMINLAFRGWGHSHLYNREKLARALKSAGFKEYQFMEWGQSKNPALAGL